MARSGSSSSRRCRSDSCQKRVDGNRKSKRKEKPKRKRDDLSISRSRPDSQTRPRGIVKGVARSSSRSRQRCDKVRPRSRSRSRDKLPKNVVKQFRRPRSRSSSKSPKTRNRSAKRKDKAKSKSKEKAFAENLKEVPAEKSSKKTKTKDKTGKAKEKKVPKDRSVNLADENATKLDKKTAVPSPPASIQSCAPAQETGAQIDVKDDGFVGAERFLVSPQGDASRNLGSSRRSPVRTRRRRSPSDSSDGWNGQILFKESPPSSRSSSLSPSRKTRRPASVLWSAPAGVPAPGVLQAPRAAMPASRAGMPPTIAGLTGAALARARGIAAPNLGYNCVDFSLGRCNRGEVCKFVHPPSGAMNPQPRPQTPALLNQGTG